MNSIIKEIREDGVFILNFDDLKYMGDLFPKYSKQLSFYGKAKLYQDQKGKVYLKSYGTTVAVMEDSLLSPENKRKIYIKGWFSKSTAVHINEFLQQNGFAPISKKYMEKLAKEDDCLTLFDHTGEEVM